MTKTVHANIQQDTTGIMWKWCLAKNCNFELRGSLAGDMLLTK